MSSDPFKQLFDPDASKNAAKDQIAAAVALINEVRNYGHRLFARSSNRPEGGDENIPILLLYFHSLEMLDAIGILIAESAPDPAQLQLRAIFEALLSMEYILQMDTVRRAHAYMVVDVVQRLEWYEKLDPSSQSGQAYLKALAADPDCQQMRPVRYDSSWARGLARVLRQPRYKEAYDKYRASQQDNAKGRKRKRRRQQWYELYGGPDSLRKLAVALNHQGAYETLYGGLSAIARAGDVIRRLLTKSRTGGPAVKATRDPSGISMIVNLAVSFALQATRLIIYRYRPGEEGAHARWFMNDVRKLWWAVDGVKPPSLPSSENAQ